MLFTDDTVGKVTEAARRASRPKAYQATPPRATTNRICNTETAAIVGSMANWMFSNVLRGSVTFEPLRYSARIRSSNDAMKAKNAPDKMLGRNCGSVI